MTYTSKGLKSGTLGKGQWGNGDIMDTLKYTATIPASLAPGEYLIRVSIQLQRSSTVS